MAFKISRLGPKFSAIPVSFRVMVNYNVEQVNSYKPGQFDDFQNVFKKY